jgi:predicted permease
LLPGHNIITIGLGVGLVTAIVTLTRALAFQALPIPNAAQVVEIWNRTETSTVIQPLTGSELIEFQQAAGNIFSQLGGFTVHRLWLENPGQRPETVGAVRLEAAAFAALDMPVIVGRAPLSNEDFAVSEAPSVWISEGFWRSRFAGRPSVIGTAMRLGMDNAPGSPMTYTIAGVMPAGATLPLPAFSTRVDLWIPLPTGLTARAAAARVFFAVGRLRAGVGPASAAAELTAIASRRSGLASEYKPVVVGILDIANRAAQRTLGLLSAATFIVFLLALLNVLGLAVAEWERRDAETTIQRALGASRLRLWGDVVAEHMILTGVAVSLGIWVAHTALPLLARLIPAAGLGPPPELMPIVDHSIIATLFLLVVTTIGLWSALRLKHDWRVPGLSRYRPGDRPSGSWRLSLLAVQVAAGVCLVVVSALVAQAYRERSTPRLGPDPAHTSIVSVRPSAPERLTDREAAAFDDELVTRLGRLTTTGAVALADFFPPLLSPTRFWTTNDLIDQPRAATSPMIVNNTYFDVLEIAIVRGRGFTANDRIGSDRVALVNMTLARQAWADPFDAIDTPIAIGTRSNVFRVIGIVDDFTGYWLQTATPMIYLNQSQQPTAGGDVLLRTDIAAGSVEGAVRTAFTGSTFQTKISGSSTLLGRWQASVSRPRARVAGMVLLAVLTLGLTIQGIYSLASMIVASRRRELAIRLAMGAPRVLVVWQLLRSVAIASGVGLIAGIVAAMAVSPVVQSWTGDTVERQVGPILLAVAGLATIAAAACVLPCVMAVRRGALQQLRET